MKNSRDSEEIKNKKMKKFRDSEEIKTKRNKKRESWFMVGRKS